MNKLLSEIVLVVDRSGSMGSCREEAQNGINHFIEEQKKQDGDANFTLVQFDNEYEFVHECVDIQTVGPFKLVPRGMTALLDAVGRTITATGERLAGMDEADRPGLVIFAVITDGIENASQEFTLKQVQAMIKEQTDVYNWQFSFLAAGPEAFGGGRAMGFSDAGSAQYDESKHFAAFHSMSCKSSRMRRSARVGEAVDNSFSKDEREDMK